MRFSDGRSCNSHNIICDYVAQKGVWRPLSFHNGPSQLPCYISFYGLLETNIVKFDCIPLTENQVSHLFTKRKLPYYITQCSLYLLLLFSLVRKLYWLQTSNPFVHYHLAVYGHMFNKWQKFCWEKLLFSSPSY